MATLLSSLIEIGQRVLELSLKDVSLYSSGGHLVY